MTDSSPAVVRLELRLGDENLTSEFRVPSRPMRAAELLPIARGIEEAVVARCVQQAEAQGRSVSCRAGCGACCRQLVTVSPTEALELARLVERLPELHRTEIRRRFADAVARLEQAGIIPANRTHLDPAEVEKIPPPAYFRLGIACPFLEEESCSIHPDRPVECRNYLVSSPPELCRDPFANVIEGIRIPLHMAGALLKAAHRLNPAISNTVPLVLALEWAEVHRAEAERTAPGPELVRALFDGLSEQ